MQAVVDRLNRTAAVALALAFLVVLLSAAGLFSAALPRTPLLLLGGLLSAALAAWLLAARRKLAAELRRKEQDNLAMLREWGNKAHWYEQLLDLVQMPITVTDNEMNWTFINAAVEKLLGKTRKEVFGRPCSQWGAGICNTRNCGVQRLRAGFGQTIFTQWGLDFLVDTSYLHDLEGKRIGQVEIVTDITTKAQVRSRVRDAIEAIVTSATQIEKATENLAGGASAQAASLEEIASTVESLNDQTRVNVESASQAREIATEAMRQAEAGNGRMGEVVAAMRGINESSENIREIVRAIRDIADQTNMLALNAAIEAARAGDAGRGFAVVAGEVGHLANKSLESVKKTTGIVENIIRSIGAASGMLDDSARQLDAILAGTKTVAEISSRTADLNQQQAEAIGQINLSLDQVNLITQETASNSEETSATIAALSRQVTDLSSVVDRMKLDNDDRQNEKLEALLAEVKGGGDLEPKRAALPAAG